ncbi:MAG: winged helix DNA-binding domain-containing protein [Planctomycetota bacterium]|nr:winged helix DNA-binding domain-containing protein [Planctomycetota bacterium]
MRTIDKRELLLASLHKQFLLAKGKRLEVVSSLCGLQAQFANNPGHALRIRSDDHCDQTWREGLVKTWTFRHTLHAIRRDELDLFISAQGVPGGWDDGWGLSRRVKPRWSSLIRGWIREGIDDRQRLKDKCRERGAEPGALAIIFHGWGGLISEMCQRGMIAYAPGTAKRFVACDDFRPLDRDAARAEILRRYFAHLGPATMDDCANFTGFRKKTILGVLEKQPLPLQSVHCAGGEYFYIGEWDASRDIPPCLLLSGFDQLLLAYRDRTRLLDDKHKPDVVTTTGIIHPAVMLDGRLKAKWKRDGRVIRVTPFAGMGQRSRRRIAACAGDLFGNDIDAVVFGEQE